VGWFAVAVVDEVPEGALVPLAAFGQDLAVGRTPSGGALVVYATCPHLGTDLTAGGLIDDEKVVCPLHEWCFSHDGACTSAGGGPIPETAELRAWPTEVVDGTIWAFHGRSGEQPPGPPPESAVPALVESHEVAGHPEDVVVGLLVDLGVTHGEEDDDGDWVAAGPVGARVLGPGTVAFAEGVGVHVTPVDGFTAAVRASGGLVPGPRAETDRSVLSDVRGWYRRFDRSTAPPRRPARSGRSGRRTRNGGIRD